VLPGAPFLLALRLIYKVMTVSGVFPNFVKYRSPAIMIPFVFILYSSLFSYQQATT
jgi:hypothetical protein